MKTFLLLGFATLIEIYRSADSALTINPNKKEHTVSPFGQAYAASH